MRAVVSIFSAAVILGACSSWAVERAVGVCAPDGGTSLVKRVHVDAGTQVVGIEIVSNDLATVFPAVRIRNGGTTDLTLGSIVGEVTNVVSDGSGHHRFVVPVGPVTFSEVGDFYIEVMLPANSGIQEIGSGPGLGAMNLAGGVTATSYIANGDGSDLQSIDADLCASLVTAAGQANKAGLLDPEPGRAPVPDETRPATLRVLTQARTTELVVLAAQASTATIDIYDTRGRLVCVLLQGNVSAGEHHLVWNGNDAKGHRAASGVYFVVARIGSEREIRKTVRIR